MKTEMKIRRTVGIGAAVVIAAALLSIVIASRSSRRLLMARATKIMAASGVDDTGLGWLSDHERLVERVKSANTSDLVCVDLAHKTIEPISALNRRYQALTSSASNAAATDDALLSPDGKWLLICNFYKGVSGTGAPAGNAPIRHKAVALSLDGKQEREFTMTQSEPAVTWLSDSRHWVEITAQKVITHSLDAPNRTSSAPIVLKPDPNGLPTWFFDPERIKRVTPADHLIADHWDPYGNSPYVLFYDVDLRANPVTPRPIMVKMPEDAEVEDVVVSRDGKWVAWKWFFYNKGPNWQSRLLPFLPKRGNALTTEVWVSHPDGSDLHEVGHIDGSFRNLAPYYLDWMPDGKRLIFSYEGALYTVPAN